MEGGAWVAEGAADELEVEVGAAQVSDDQAEEDDWELCQFPPQGASEEVEAQVVEAGCKTAATTVGVAAAVDEAHDSLWLSIEDWKCMREGQCRKRMTMLKDTLKLTAVEEALLAAELDDEDTPEGAAASLTLQILPPLFLYFRETLPVLLLMAPSGIPFTVASLA